MDGVKIFAVLFILFGIYSVYNSPPKAPVLPETWWGPGNNESVDVAIKPFKILFSDELIKDLKFRLKNTRPMVPALERSGWTYGMDGSYVATITDYWLNKYDFKKREAHLNQYPQFTTNIQGLNIHYLHVKPKKIAGKHVLPLLLQHGWPGSVVEFYKILPLLTTPREEHDFVFEVIVPSLPGFGFSSAAIKPGLGSAQMAVVLKNLMSRLGFEKFYFQGGDWGAVTGANLAALFPEHVLGLHSNMCIDLSLKTIIKWVLYGIAPSLLLPEEHQHLMFPVKDKVFNLIEQSGYFHIQATKPDTVGREASQNPIDFEARVVSDGLCFPFGLRETDCSKGVGPSDSPAALAVYILEKFSGATKPDNKFKKDGGLLNKFSFDELLDNLMMYWVPNSATTAMRIYAETYTATNRNFNFDAIKVTVPTACAQFPYEIFYQPMDFLKNRFPNLLRTTIMPRGGHFAALEEPELLANDVWESIAEMESLRGIKNKNQQEDAKQKSNEL